MKFFDYKESKQHGSFDFPIELYEVNQTHPRYNMPYHWHTEYEIINILKGKFPIVVNNEKILLQKGDIVFIQAGIFHGGNPIDCTYECVVFDMNLLLKQNHACTKQIQDIINHTKIIKPKLPNAINELTTCCSFLFESLKQKKFGYELIAQGSLYHLLGILLQNNLFTNNKVFKRNAEKILQLKRVLSIIENNYSDQLTLCDLSKACGMTPKYFCRFFSQMTNKTPIEYLNYYRIEVACEQLLTSDLSVTEVALNCGFNDLSYFIKTFKKHKKLTPKQYLKTYNCNVV